MNSRYRNCPVCGRKGWHSPKNAERGFRRCRYCGHDNGLELSERRLARTLEKAQKSVHDAIDKAKG